MIAASEGANNTHLETLSRLSTLLMDEGFRKQLLEAKDESELLQLFDEKENEKKKRLKSQNQKEMNRTYLLLQLVQLESLTHIWQRIA